MAIPQALLMAYEQKRDAHARQLAERRRQVELALPEFVALEQEIAHLLVLQARQALAHPDQVAAQADDTTAAVVALRGQQRTLLPAAGWPPDYLQPIYECADCQDTGFIGSQARPCACLLQQLADYVCSTITPQLATQNFETFDPLHFPEVPLPIAPVDTQRGYMVKIRRFCENYAQSLPQPVKPHLLLQGVSGTGKTFLCHCIAKRALDRRLTVMVLPYYALLERLFIDRGIKKTALAVDLLVLDDLGSEPMLNNVTLETLYQLLNDRTRFGKSIVLSTNLTPHELVKRYTERVTSRLLSSQYTQMLPLYGQDVRLDTNHGGMKS